jgi:hypothetical protein
MIVVKITGGLGNQIFQYAYGLALAKYNNTELWCDLSGYKSGQDVRVLELRKIFNVKHSAVINSLKYFRHVKERTFQFNPALKTLGNFHYVSGYFQSYKYFEPFNLLLKFTDSVHFDYVRELVKATGADTCIHIRRGDYLTSLKHYVLPDSYYMNALSKFNSKKVIIFSDDKNYASMFKARHCMNGQMTFEVWDSIDAVHDLAAMSFFKNIVMANSTFSWWAAYLSNARVICPKKYFCSDVNMDDFYLPSWEQI